jgi:CDP-diacylglycerol pyrophosphatase
MARSLLYKTAEQMTCYQFSVTVIKNAIAEDSHKTQNVYYIHIICLRPVSAGIGRLQIVQNTKNT